jgi:RNA polymerase sigma-70 factor (sigma-E family)
VTGNRDGFRDYVLARQQGLLRAAWMLTGDWGLAEDLVQTALMKAWKRWDVLESEDPDAYVRRILVNTHATWWRRLWRNEIPTAEHPEPVGSMDGQRVVEDRDRLTRMLKALPRRQRAILVLRYFEDLSEQDTATALGCSVGTVKSQASRGLAKLRLDQFHTTTKSQER